MVVKLESLSIYDDFFKPKQSDEKTVDWGKFNLFETSVIKNSYSVQADFSVNATDKNWKNTAKKILIFSLKIIIFPWGIYKLTKYFFQRIVMMNIYPLQSKIVKKIYDLTDEKIDELRQTESQKLVDKGFVVRHVFLEKNHVRYSGLLIGHKDTIQNGNWVLQATGNMEPIEFSFPSFAEAYRRVQFNVLLVNGPGAVRSEGVASNYTLGEAQEVGISFLENSINAKKIILAGRSLGGAAISEAIMQHDFKPNIEYMVIRQMTFDSVSNIASKIFKQSFSKKIRRFIKQIIRWTDCEIDSVQASIKVANLNIREIIVQATNKDIRPHETPKKEDFKSDGVIDAHASLAYRLIKYDITANKAFICLKDEEHNSNNPVTAPFPEIVNILEFKESLVLTKNIFRSHANSCFEYFLRIGRIINRNLGILS